MKENGVGKSEYAFPGVSEFYKQLEQAEEIENNGNSCSYVLRLYTSSGSTLRWVYFQFQESC